MFVDMYKLGFFTDNGPPPIPIAASQNLKALTVLQGDHQTIDLTCSTNVSIDNRECQN